MKAEDVTATLDLALKASGCDQAMVVHKHGAVVRLGAVNFLDQGSEFTFDPVQRQPFALALLIGAAGNDCGCCCGYLAAEFDELYRSGHALHIIMRDPGQRPMHVVENPPCNGPGDDRQRRQNGKRKIELELYAEHRPARRAWFGRPTAF